MVQKEKITIFFDKRCIQGERAGEKQIKKNNALVISNLNINDER